MIEKNLSASLPYMAPSCRTRDCRTEYSFLLSNPSGSIPALEEGEVPDDFWN